jgi:hypothetical protein
VRWARKVDPPFDHPGVRKFVMEHAREFGFPVKVCGILHDQKLPAEVVLFPGIHVAGKGSSAPRIRSC